MSNILIKPLITEKMSFDTERNNSYGFVVADGANKIEIKKSVESAYGVTVTSVRTLRGMARLVSATPRQVWSAVAPTVTRRP